MASASYARHGLTNLRLRAGNRYKSSRPNNRFGSLTLELLLLLPILLALLCAIVYFAALETHRHRVIHASCVAARVASQGGQGEDVRQAVHQVLGIKCLCEHANVHIELGCNTGDKVLVRVEVPTKCVLPNLLWYVGFCNENDRLVGQTVLRKE